VDFYGEEHIYTEVLVPSLREKLSSFSEFMREIKVGFARFYNLYQYRRGYFWGDRFKSVIVQKGETLINCLAYIDLQENVDVGERSTYLSIYVRSGYATKSTHRCAGSASSQIDTRYRKEADFRGFIRQSEFCLKVRKHID